MSPVSNILREFRIRKTCAKAKELVARNRHVDAINLLQFSNRLLKSPDIEVILVNLRHEAFFHQKFDSGFLQWPPEVKDTLNDAKGIPEIRRDQMNGSVVRDSVFTHGSIIIRDLLDQKDVELLRESIQQTYKFHDLYTEGATDEQTKPWFVPFQAPPRGAHQELDRAWYRDGGADLAADSPRGLFNLIECLESNLIIDMATQYLGERPALSVRKTSLREIPHDLNTEFGWHQDGAFLGQDIRSLNVWIALSDCGVDAPSMDMVPRRLDYIVPTGTEGSAFDWSVSPKMIDQACAGEPPTHLNFRAGDAIIFDEMNLHRTSTRPGMTKSRFAIEAWFFAPSSYPMDQLPILL